MKKILFMLAAILLALPQLKAQTSLVATLRHEGNLSTYFGANALIQAYEAAVDGDVITLSAGMFNAVNLDKSITLRGSGFNNDAETGRQATYINGTYKIGSNDNTTSVIVVEGIFFNNTGTLNSFKRAQFIKCRVGLSDYYKAAKGELTFINCRVNAFTMTMNLTAQFINSLIVMYSINYPVEFKNCVLLVGNTLQQSTLDNSILIFGDAGNLSKSVATNCVAIGSNSYTINQVSGSNNAIATGSEVFKEFTNNYDDEHTFELTDEAKTKYIGSDGTEIGLYGGMLPYDPTPSTPQIKKFKVAQRSTADGKLSVDITVGIPE